MNPLQCDELDALLPELAARASSFLTGAPETDASVLARADAHVAACSPCAARLAREVRLVALLASAATVPAIVNLAPLRVPALPAGWLPDAQTDGPTDRSTPLWHRAWTHLRARPAAVASFSAALATAAAVLLVLAVSPDLGGVDAPASHDDVAQAVEPFLGPAELTFVDSGSFSSGPDERLLALVGGPEAVAARRSVSSPVSPR